MGSFSKEEIEHFFTTNQFRIAVYKKNAVIHFDGDFCDKLEIILSGKVLVDRIDEHGNLLTISDFKNGDILGGNLMFSSSPYYLMTVTAATEAAILEITTDLLFNLMNSNKKFLRAYLEFVSDRTSILGNKIKHYIKTSIRESILNYLKIEQSKQQKNQIVLNTSKTELSEKFGVQRTSLSRELGKMKKEGLIDFDKSTITILKKANLKNSKEKNKNK
ncbi:MAG: Crp/Fnr family transcriptional regulator [Clostridiales bacterium]|nr:Crp/Fnr family transcriptional regulator [Clostridiales bacterium]